MLQKYPLITTKKWQLVWCVILHPGYIIYNPWSYVGNYYTYHLKLYKLNGNS